MTTEMAISDEMGMLELLDTDDTVAGAQEAPISSDNVPHRTALRLPSFEALGIANPHSNLLRTASASMLIHPARTASKEAIPVRGRITGPRANINSARNLLPPAAHVVATLTPPSEGHDILWSASDGQHAVQQSSVPPMAAEEQIISKKDSFLTPHTTPYEQATGPDKVAWLDAALEALFTSRGGSATQAHTLKVLSHALPCPSMEGHVFSRIMSALYEHSSSSTTTWINVFHALPGRFNLSELPRSPPTTPGQPFQGEDYFTQKVFDSAITIADYHTDLSLLPRSPRPAVPPGSVDLAVVERYIPPTSSLEFASMFDIHAPSILLDRLVELSPNNGSLLFVYPTKTGARTFTEKYLSPVLDPTLRSLAVMHSLPMAFCAAIGRQPVIEDMHEYDNTQMQLQRLCQQLSRPVSLAPSSSTPQYKLVHSATGLVHPSRQVWANEWWVKQEKSRLREEISRWTQEATLRRQVDSFIVDRSVASAEVSRQLLEGVTKRPYPQGQEPLSGIEVNVFVIKRTQ